MSAFDADAVITALLAKAAQLQSELEARIQTNLSGAVLNERSGKLLASISSDIEDDGTTVSVAAGSTGVAYAAIQEYGGRTAAHDIVALKGKALAFVTGGGEVFAAHVHHPGSTIPARSYLGSALDAMQDEIQADMTQAILDALQN